MSTRWAALLAGVALVAAGCSSSSNGQSTLARFCDTANRYETEIGNEASAGKVNAAKQLTIVTQLAAEAPAAVRADAATFLSALRQVSRDPHLRDSPAIKRAVDNVNRYASQKCGFFNQQPEAM